MNQPSTFQLPKLTTLQIVQATLLVVAIVALFAFAFRFYQLVLILFAAVILGTALKTAVTYLTRFNIPEAVSVILIYALALAILVAFVGFGIPLISKQAAPLTSVGEELYGDVYTRLQGRENRLLRQVGQRLPPTLFDQTAVGVDAEVEGAAEDDSLTLSQGFVWLSRIGKWLVWMIATLVIAFYWTLDGERIKYGMFLILPARYRERAREVMTAIESKVGNYVIGQGLLSLSIAILAFIAYLLIGLPYAFVLALFAGLMEAVPMIGPAIGAIPALLVALTVSPTMALWVLVATAVMQQLENSILFPRIMNRAVGVSALVALLAFIGFSAVFGVVGAILSIPLAAVLQLLIERLLLSRESVENNLDGARDSAGLLRYELLNLVQDVRSQIRKKEKVATATSDQIEDSIEAIALDLNSILAQNNEQEATT